MSGVKLHRSQEAGFTLLEVVFSLVIAVIMMAMTTVAMRPSIEQEGARGLAYTLASDLRAARAEAIRSGHPVAFCFPSDGQTNSLSRSANIRKGDQRGEVSRSVSYASEYAATIFIGKWSGGQHDTYSKISPSWKASTSRESALFFGPDGRAYSEDLAQIEGRYPLVIASTMEVHSGGPEGELKKARNPQTIWVAKGGAVEVEENRVPGGELPQGGTDQLAVAQLAPETHVGGNAPTLVDANFLPQQIEGIDSAGIGQNFIQIHPNQRDGQQLEYGLATIEVKAEDRDGGPLTYVLSAEPSTGDPGNFSIAKQEGEMTYVYDNDKHGFLWKAVVSWRPPPGAPVDCTYELSMTISDPDGNTVVASTQAGLLPGIVNLPAARIVMETNNGRLFLTNLDGANEIRITTPGSPEYDPFFSRDGSSIFSFYRNDDGTRQLRGRPANGSREWVGLATLSGASTALHFDPTLTYAAIMTPAGNETFPYGVLVTVSPGPPPDYDVEYHNSTVPVTHIDIVNLMSTDPPISITNKGDGSFIWAADARHTFRFGEEQPTPLINPFGLGPFNEAPGHEVHDETRSLVGYPPMTVPHSGDIESAAGRIYNPADEDWYLIVEGDKLMARNQITNAHITVHDGANYEFDVEDLRENPSWSADGERVAYVVSPGADAHVFAKHILTEGMLPRPAQQILDLPAAWAHSAQLSPEGRWTYYQRSEAVFRAENRDGGKVVNISKHLDANIEDFAVSP